MKNKTAYIWGLIGRFAPQVIYLATTMILARFLTPDDFGQIGVLSVIFTVAYVLMDSGLGGSLIKEKDISDIDCSSIAFFNLCISVSIYALLFLLSDTLEIYFEVDGLSNVIRVLGLVFPITAFGIVPRALLNRNLQFKKVSENLILAVILAAAVSIIIAIFGGGVYAIVSYQLANNLITVILNSIALKYHFSIKFSLSSLKRLLPFGITTSIITVVDTVYENILTTLTGKYMNIQEAGYLYQAKRLEESLTQSIATTIGSVTFPIMTRLKNSVNEFHEEAMATFKTIISLLCPVLLIVALFSDEIVHILYGEQWMAAGFYLKMLTFGGIFIIMDSLFRNYIKALCEVKKLLVATIIKRSLGLSLIFGALLVNSRYMIYAYILSAFIGFMINYSLYRNITKSSFIDMVKMLMQIITPCVVLYLLVTLSSVIGNEWIKVLTAILMLLIIYLFYLPKVGINIVSPIIKFIHK